MRGFNEWSLLNSMTTRAETIVESNKVAKNTVITLQKAKHDKEMQANDLKRTANRCTAIYKDVFANLQEKKKSSLIDYNSAISETNKIVADSNINDMKVKIDGKRAFIANSKGHDLNEREGSAERGAVGLLMRYVSMVKQPFSVIPMMIFDETFFTMSDNTCDEVRDYLVEFSKHYLILAIEQKDTLFNGIQDKIVYNFKLDKDGKTRIETTGE